MLSIPVFAHRCVLLYDTHKQSVVHEQTYQLRYILWTFWLLPVATIIVITVLTIVAWKKLKTSKTTIKQESRDHFHQGSNTFTDLFKGDRLQDGWREKSQFTDKDQIYNEIDDAKLSVPRASSFASYSSPEPYMYSVSMNKADLNNERNYYDNERNPAHTSKTAEQRKKEPLCHFESYTSGVDEEGYMEMKEIVSWLLLEMSFSFAESNLKLTERLSK